MSLSGDLISQFVKATKDTTKPSTESTAFGTAKVEHDGRVWVKLDGSELLTPVTSTTEVKDGERVTVLIKDHTATITGNTSSPSARKETVDNIGSQLLEVDALLAYKVTTEELYAAKATIEELRAISAKFSEMEATTAEIETLYAKFANLEYVSAKDADILNAEIESLRAQFAVIKDLSTEDFEAANAKIDTLKGYTADFTYVSADRLSAVVAQIKTLDAEKLSADSADIRYANIDFANISEAAVKKIFSDYGVIKELIISEGTVVKELVGVTIKGDLIEAGTLKADKIVVKGSDGLYYKLNIEAGAVASTEVAEEELQNGLHGTAIIAKTITAEKIRVDDLVAFGATIGGFHITTNSIYSGVKSSADNTTRGIYLDNDGQVVFGDTDNYVKFYKNSDNKYALDISANSIRLAASDTTVESMLQKAEDAADKVDELENRVNSGEFAGEGGYSVILTSYAHTFPGTTDAAKDGSTTTQVIGMCGATVKPVTIDVNNIIAPEGVTVISDEHAISPTLTIAVTTTVTTGGTITIPVTVGEVTINKEFSFAIAFTGADGGDGQKGDTGVGVAETHRYYLLQSSTLAAPSKPTTYPLPSNSPWTDTEPEYVEGSSDNLYVVDCTVFSDGSYTYSPVSLSSSYEAAKKAYDKALEAVTKTTEINASITQINGRIDLNTEKIESISVGGRNLIVKRTSTPDQYIGSDGSVIEDSSLGISLTDYIQIAPGIEYTFSRSAGEGDSFRIALYDGAEPPNYISGSSDLISAIAPNAEGNYVWTAPDEARYIRVSYPADDESKAKFEKGNTPTDYTPAPEDMATIDDYDILSKSYSNLSANIDDISAVVGRYEERQNAFGERVDAISQTLSATMSSTDITIKINEAVESVTNGGVKQVNTETGIVIDNTGITVNKSGAPTKTTITEDGMTITESGDDGDTLLTADSTGVNAKNLHATTYLIVGKNSRFEDYQNDTRTGCFWIGR